MMSNLRQRVANAAIELILEHKIIGIGTGRTVDCLIIALTPYADEFKAVVASSKQVAQKLRKAGFLLADLNDLDSLPIYVDSADAYNLEHQLIKGRGGALAQEKVLAYASDNFLCLVDQTKPNSLALCDKVPVEVLPMARSMVARQVCKLHGSPRYREDFVSDNGNIIIDVSGWELQQPIKLETTLNSIPGVVENGIFAIRRADKILSATNNGVTEL